MRTFQETGLKLLFQLFPLKKSVKSLIERVASPILPSIVAAHITVRNNPTAAIVMQTRVQVSIYPTDHPKTCCFADADMKITFSLLFLSLK